MAEIIPVELISDPTEPWKYRLHGKGSSVATARLDLSTVPFNAAMPVDRRISLNFKVSQSAVMDPNQTYAVYLHVAPGSVDRLGLGGVETDANPGMNVYTRQFDTPPLSVESGLWGLSVRRDLDFSLTFADVCGD
jgi:hypothetical protein